MVQQNARGLLRSDIFGSEDLEREVFRFAHRGSMPATIPAVLRACRMPLVVKQIAPSA